MNPEKLNNALCCGEPANIMPDKNGDIEGFGIWCNTCKHAIHHENRDTAIKIFLEGANKPPVSNPQNQGARRVNNNSNQMVISERNVTPALQDRKNNLALAMSPILNGSNSAMERLWKNNTEKYPLSLKGKAWDKVFSTPEGQQSVIDGIEESLLICAELGSGKGGHLVTFGNVCEFIPDIEAIKFYLTSGNNAPFEKITIECLYEDDEFEIWTEDGDFHIKNKQGQDRSKVKAVAVYGTLVQDGSVIGDTYGAKRLLEKACEHSAPYKNYMRKYKAYEYQKSEGKIKVDNNGRESFTFYETAKSSSEDPYFEANKKYFKDAEANNNLKQDGKGDYAEKTINGKNGSFPVKIYRYQIEGGEVATTVFLDELSNPYAGADQPEMLRKTAGKSFLAQFKKTRGSRAAMHEVRTQKGGVNRALDMAEEQFKDVSEVVD